MDFTPKFGQATLIDGDVLEAAVKLRFYPTWGCKLIQAFAIPAALWMTVLQVDRSFAQGAIATWGSDIPVVQPTADRLIGTVTQNEAIPGLIVGVSWHRQRSFLAYSGTGQAAYEPGTIVEIGSITKVFTTALFAEAIAEGRMTSDTPLKELLPDRTLRPCTGRITALQLADFSSGMPELPGDAPRELARRGIDTYTSEDFLRWVSRWAPDEEEGCNLPAPYRYSNASVGLLGYLVADRLGAPWQGLVWERITEPLRMTSTAIEISPSQRNRAAQGFGQDGQPVMPWPVFAWYPAGALRSSATDMLAFGEAALMHDTVNGNRVPPLLVRALQDAMRPIYQPRDQLFAQGLAWIEEEGDPDDGQHPVYLKTGGTDGFNSVLVINPAKDLAIFMAASRPRSGMLRLGVELSRQLRR